VYVPILAYQGSTSLHLDRPGLRHRLYVLVNVKKGVFIMDTAISTYNGWSNRETWVVNLWLTNEECFYYELCSIIKNFDEAYEQAEELEGYVHFILEASGQYGLESDLRSASLGRVNWHEIVENNQEVAI
jgi:hypothetical protein